MQRPRCSLILLPRLCGKENFSSQILLCLDSFFSPSFQRATNRHAKDRRASNWYRKGHFPSSCGKWNWGVKRFARSRSRFQRIWTLSRKHSVAHCLFYRNAGKLFFPVFFIPLPPNESESESENQISRLNCANRSNLNYFAFSFFSCFFWNFSTWLNFSWNAEQWSTWITTTARRRCISSSNDAGPIWVSIICCFNPRYLLIINRISFFFF